jgi:small-conductance mechanosensitive channel
MIVQQWADVFTRSFQDLWWIMVQFAPRIEFAVVVLILGWLVGAIAARLIEQLMRVLRVDTALKGAGVEDLAPRAGVSLNSGRFLGKLVEWFIILAFLTASLEFLGLTQVTMFLQQVVLLYLPQVIVAVLVLVLTAVVADMAKRGVVASARAAGAHSVALMGAVTKWSIWTTGILVALTQLGIAAAFAQTLFTGFVIALSLAFGLAFGLGGKDHASDFIGKMRKEMNHHE